MNYDLFIPPSVAEQMPAGSAARPRASRSLSGGVSSPGATRDAGSAPPLTEQVGNTVAAMNGVLEHANVGLRYRIDDVTRDLVVSVVDRDSGEVIRQIPPDQILSLRQHFQELMGTFFEVTA